MAAGRGGRVRVWPARVGALAVAGGLLGLLAWRSDLPYKSGFAACLGAALLVLAAGGLAVEWARRPWDDRAATAHRTGEWDRVPPPPRGAAVAAAVGALGLAGPGAVLLALGLAERFG